MAKLRVGFIGAGGIATGAHLPAFLKLEKDVQVVAAADIAPAALDNFAQKAGLTADQCYSNWEQMLDQVPLDVAVICTPNCFHHPQTVAAFAKGCHVLTEKPVGISAQQAREMTAAGHKAGKLFMVGQTLRFTKGAAMMKRWVDEGSVGNIYWARCQYLRVRGVPGKGFIVKEASAGGPIYDIGVHVLDLGLWLMGFPEPSSVLAGVYCNIARQKSALNTYGPEKYTVPEDAAFSLIRFKNGATISLECSWALNIPGPSHNVVVCGDKGGAQWEPLALLTERKGALERITPEIFPYPEPAGHFEEVRAFVEAIKKGKPSPVPGEEALITQRILDAIYKSGETGKEVTV